MFIEKDIMVKDSFWLVYAKVALNPYVCQDLCTPGLVYAKVAQMVEILGLPQVDRTGEGRKEEETLIEPQIEKHFQNKQQWPTTEICKPSSTFTRSPCKSTQPPATEHQCQKSAKSTQVQQLEAMVGGKAKFARGATFWSNIWFQPKHIENADLEFDSPPKQPPSLYCLLPHSMAPLTFLTAHYTPTGMRHTKCVSNSRWSYPLQLG